jgi:glucosylceramidase
MTKFISITSFGFVLAAVACSSENPPTNPGGGSGSGSGSGGGSTAGTNPGTAGSAQPVGGISGVAGTTGTAGSSAPTGGSSPTTGGSSAAAGTTGTAGTSPTAGTGGGGPVTPVNLPPLVTSAPGAYWKTDATPTDSTAAATVTVNDTMLGQKWDGFGGAFNELGWKYLTSAALQAEAIKLLFSATDGANLLWGRIPMGASDYATSRYTLDDNAGADPVPSGETNRPAADTTLSKFSLARDKMLLIPYIKAAQAVKPDIRFWGSPWTPPVWMKTGYKMDAGGSGTAKKASFYDGGTVTNTPANLQAYAEYYKKFVEGYKAEGINVEIVSPQNEPGYDQNYPSALWDKATYVAWVNALGPVMKAINVKVMLGTLSNAGDNSRNDLDIATAVMADATAKTFVSVAGVQWGVLGKVVEGASIGGLPVWATEHKCGNYPWNPMGYPAYNNSQAPNDQAYGEESWGYIRDAITKAKVTSYAAWNMVLDKSGLGIDTSRDWKQNALLVVDGGMVKPTPTYYVFRHFSQYVQPNANVVGTSGGDAVAFKNPDGSLVAVMFSKTANPSYVVQIGGKKLQFSMPANGWATVRVKP